MLTLRRVRDSIPLQEIADAIGGTIDGQAALDITGVAPITSARPTEIAFLANKAYAGRVAGSGAGALLVADDFADEAPMPLVRTKDPYLAFARTLELFFAYERPDPGVHATALVPDSCDVSAEAWIGPYAVLGERVRVGARALVHPHAVVYSDAVLGEDVVLHSHAVVREGVVLGDRTILQNGAVVGADGFGFARTPDGGWHRILQSGTVRVAEDVEVQAHACIDRAAIGETTIGRGTKIDNLVQIGHGSKVGEHTLLCGQVGLAGSSSVGSHVVLGGQVGVAGHLEIGDGAQVAAQAGVMTSLPGGAQYGGSPASDMRMAKAQALHLMRLPDLAKRVKELEKKVPPAPSS